MSDPFLGEIRMVGFTFAPYGWAFCQGQTVSVAQNSALYTLLGTVYGGNATSFQLPNFAGRSPVGIGTGPGLTPVNPGDQAGVETVSVTVNNLPAHTHTAAVTGGGSVTGNLSIPATTLTTNATSTPGNTAVLGSPVAAGHPVNLYSTNPPNTTLAPVPVSLQGSAPAIQIGLTGNSAPIGIRNPYLGINFIIAMQGVFPPRS